MELLVHTNLTLELQQIFEVVPHKCVFLDSNSFLMTDTST